MKIEKRNAIAIRMKITITRKDDRKVKRRVYYNFYLTSIPFLHNNIQYSVGSGLYGTNHTDTIKQFP